MKNKKTSQKEKEEDKQSSQTAKKESQECCKEEKKGFSFGRVFFGLVILIIGLIYLLNNLGVTNISLNLSFNIIWPIIVVGIGLSILSGKGWFSVFLGTIVILVLIGAAIWLFTKGTLFNQTSQIKTDNFNITQDARATEAVINIKSGAGKLNLSDDFASFVSGYFQSNGLTLNNTSTVIGNREIIDLEIANYFNILGASQGNTLGVKVNPNFPMIFNIDTGASEMDLNFANISAKEINIKTGASKLLLTMGDKLKESYLKIDAGASSVDVKLPNGVGVLIKLSSGLSSKNLTNFTQIDEKNFKSVNYDFAENKINLDLDLGATDLNVGWY